MKTPEEATQILLETIQTCSSYIYKTAVKEFDNDASKMDFILSCCINLTGNTVINHSNNNVEDMKLNSLSILKEMAGWFNKIINQIEKEQSSESGETRQ